MVAVFIVAGKCFYASLRGLEETLEAESSFFIGGGSVNTALPEMRHSWRGCSCVVVPPYASCQDVNTRKLSVSITASREPCCFCSRATWQRRRALVIGCQSLAAASLWGPVYLYFRTQNSPACLCFPDKRAKLSGAVTSAASLFLLLAGELNRLCCSSYGERLNRRRRRRHQRPHQPRLLWIHADQ